jgi:hypothetical protein
MLEHMSDPADGPRIDAQKSLSVVSVHMPDCFRFFHLAVHLPASRSSIQQPPFTQRQSQGAQMEPHHRLYACEGRLVSITLRDGTVLNDCVVVSVGRGNVQTLWVFTEDGDMFIPRSDVTSIDLSRRATAGRAA